MDIFSVLPAVPSDSSVGKKKSGKFSHISSSGYGKKNSGKSPVRREWSPADVSKAKIKGTYQSNSKVVGYPALDLNYFYPRNYGSPSNQHWVKMLFSAGYLCVIPESL